MKAYIALGSNLGEPTQNLEAAAGALAKVGKGLRASPVFRTPALLPEGGPLEWCLPFHNAVVEMEWTGSPPELLSILKNIERELGRVAAPRWSPRKIDLDLLALGNEISADPNCQVPHPQAWKRSFVLDPLKHLAPSLVFPGRVQSVLQRARALPERGPLWMGILNLTPDSFSDGGALAAESAIPERLERFERAGVQALDLGAESTRPGASFVSFAEEWERLKGTLEFLRERYRGRFFRPLISVDTRHAATAVKAIEYGADIINDVSGLADPAMLGVIQSSRCQYVLMHSLSVPADPQNCLPRNLDPVLVIHRWMEERLELLQKSGVPLDRVLLDPGIGFGKTAPHSLQVLKRAGELLDLPARVLVGHSRKSFLRLWGERDFGERDGWSLGISLRLAEAGAEVVRVHEAHLHADAWQAYSEVRK